VLTQCISLKIISYLLLAKHLKLSDITYIISQSLMIDISGKGKVYEVDYSAGCPCIWYTSERRQNFPFQQIRR